MTLVARCVRVPYDIFSRNASMHAQVIAADFIKEKKTGAAVKLSYEHRH